MRPLRGILVSRPAFERLRFGLLALVGVLLAHDAIFAAQVGMGEGPPPAFAATAHDYWPVFTAVALLGGMVGAGWAITVVLRLHRALRGLPAPTHGAMGPGYLREVTHLWPRLLAVVTLAFALQENLEHLLAGLPAPGLWVLSAPGYPLAIPVLAAVTALLAAAGGWLRWHQRVLLGRIAAARTARLRTLATSTATPRAWRLVAALVVHGRILTRLDAGRAPPVPLLA